MKKILGILSVGLLVTLLAASFTESKESKNDGDTGIRFEKMTLAQAKKKAIETGKIIFIDCYTDWCGPCKRMAATAFKDDRVGKLYNSSFINLKVEMEKDADGPEIARMYQIKAYPTLLMIDGKGNLIKQAIGMQSADQLIALAKSVK